MSAQPHDQQPMGSEFAPDDLRYFAALLREILWLNTARSERLAACSHVTAAHWERASR